MLVPSALVEAARVASPRKAEPASRLKAEVRKPSASP